MKVIYHRPSERGGLTIEAGEGSNSAGYVIESGTVGCVISKEEAEGMSRALLDDLGLDHLAQSLDLDRLLKNHEPRPEPSGGVAELSALMASAGMRLPGEPNPIDQMLSGQRAMVEGQLASAERNAKEGDEVAWLMQVMETAAHLYSTRILNELGGSDPLIAAPGPKPVPDGVMRALYTDEEIAVLRSQAGQLDQAALWQQCVHDAFALMHLVRGYRDPDSLI